MLLLDPVNQTHQERQSDVQQSGGILQWSCRQGIRCKILTEEAFAGAEGFSVEARVTTEKLNITESLLERNTFLGGDNHLPPF